MESLMKYRKGEKKATDNTSLLFFDFLPRKTQARKHILEAITWVKWKEPHTTKNKTFHISRISPWISRLLMVFKRDASAGRRTKSNWQPNTPTLFFLVFKATCYFLPGHAEDPCLKSQGKHYSDVHELFQSIPGKKSHSPGERAELFPDGQTKSFARAEGSSHKSHITVPVC